MFGKKTETTVNELGTTSYEEKKSVFKKNEKDIKSLIAPGGIDASYTNHIEISSSRTRYARSMVVANVMEEEIVQFIIVLNVILLEI